jgi:hypothetical protein
MGVKQGPIPREIFFLHGFAGSAKAGSTASESASCPKTMEGIESLAHLVTIRPPVGPGDDYGCRQYFLKVWVTTPRTDTI